MQVRVLAIVTTLFLAGTASAMDLMDLYREAKSHDARYAAAQAQFRAEREAVSLARAGVVPKSNSGGASMRHRHRDVAGFHSFSFGRWHRYRSEPLRPTFR